MGIHKEKHQLINCKSNSSGIIIVHKIINNNILSVQEKKIPEAKYFQKFRKEAQ